MKQQPRGWKERRRGFKHELILTLRDEGFSHREAEQVVDAIFDSIKVSLLRRESVEIDNFGTFFVPERLQKKGYRFGRVVEFGGRKAAFKVDKTALDSAFDPNWNPHASWLSTEKRAPKLRGKKLRDFNRLHEESQRRIQRWLYVRIIVRFFGTHLMYENWPQFWFLRWQSSWYKAEVGNVQQASTFELHAIEDAEQVIASTAPTFLNPESITRSVELVWWYARWTCQLDVDRELWEEAEREAFERLKRNESWVPFFASSNSEPFTK